MEDLMDSLEDDFDDEPRSVPCSAEEAKHGLPVMVQLHLVDSELEKNPHPREDFYRQYSVTPEPQILAEDAVFLPPNSSLGVLLQESKDWAARVAKGLRQFHDGRVMLRKEEAERHGGLEEDRNYWDSKASEWQDETLRLVRELRRRRKKELKGEAAEGYAREMVLSPVVLPYGPPCLPEAMQQIKPITATGEESYEEIDNPLQPHATPSQQLPPPKPTPDPPALTKGKKRTHAEVEEFENPNSDQCSRPRKQPKIFTTAQRDLLQALANGGCEQCPGRHMPKDAGIDATEESKPRCLYTKEMMARPPLSLKLKIRDLITYIETPSSGAAVDDSSDQQIKKEAQQKVLRWMARKRELRHQ